jgi:tRNA-dihydrouridine synthase B
VLRYTGADGLLIGRAAQGRPWIFDEIGHYLDTGERLPEKSPAEIGAILIEHLEALHAFYGEDRGVRIARKHLGWYAKAHPGSEAFLQAVNRVEHAARQVDATRAYFDNVQRGLEPVGHAADQVTLSRRFALRRNTCFNQDHSRSRSRP